METMHNRHDPSFGIDPALVPERTLYTGATMPGIGMGTFGNDRYSAQQMADAVSGAISVGWRNIDCAAVYGNEKEIGQALGHALNNGIKREELFISSKLWNDRHHPEMVRPALEKSLADLGLDYLDIYYIHWPFPNGHALGAGHDDRSAQSRPYDPKEYLAVYHELEKAVDAKLIRHIGTSNLSISKMDTLLKNLIIPPAVNQMEMHPAFSQTEFFEYLSDKGILPVAYCPLGSPSRPVRDHMPSDVKVMEHPIIVRLAERREVHPSAICLKWAVKRGQVPLPSSVKPEQYIANLRAVISDPLTDDEMREIARVDSCCRLVKGQVFLWEGAHSWKDLWDEK